MLAVSTRVLAGAHAGGPTRLVVPLTLTLWVVVVTEERWKAGRIPGVNLNPTLREGGSDKAFQRGKHQRGLSSYSSCPQAHWSLRASHGLCIRRGTDASIVEHFLSSAFLPQILTLILLHLPWETIDPPMHPGGPTELAPPAWNHSLSRNTHSRHPGSAPAVSSPRSCSC